MKKVTKVNTKNNAKVSEAITLVSLIDNVVELNNFKTIPHAFYRRDECLTK